MFQMIRNRLQAVEQARKKSDAPDVVMVYRDSVNGGWIAQEQYVKKNLNGKVIPHSGTVKLIPLINPEEYRPPEGFRGTILIGEGDLE